MSYGTKYNTTFCDFEGISYEVKIQERDYVGSVTLYDAGTTPCTISYEAQDDFIFSPIRSSVCRLELVLGNALEMEDLWTADERKYRVEVTRNSVLYWRGFIIPEGFQYELSGGRYYATIEATDGLETLSGIDFKYTAGGANENYGTQDLTFNDLANIEKYPFILIVTEILAKLGLDIDTWTCVDFYESTMTKTGDRIADPLANAYVNVKTFINDTDREDIAYWQDVNEPWDCERVLTNVLNIFGARIYQFEGVWRIKSISADALSSFPFKLSVGIGTYAYQVLKIDSGYSGSVCSATAANAESVVLFTQIQTITSITYNDELYYKDSLLTQLADAGSYKFPQLGIIIQIDGSGAATSFQLCSGEFNYYWRKYNTASVYLGKEAIQPVKAIACAQKEDLFVEDIPLVSMDDVYKRFRVNYKYTFVRIGDSPIQLLKNGNFIEPYDNISKTAAPPFWRKMPRDNKYYPKARVIDIPIGEQPLAGNNTKALQYLVQPPAYDSFSNMIDNPQRWVAMESDAINVNDTDTYYFSFRIKSRMRNAAGTEIYFPVWRIILSGDDGKTYFAQNDLSQNSKYYRNYFKWAEKSTLDWTTGSSGLFVECGLPDSDERPKDYSLAVVDDKLFKWRSFKYELANMPTSGTVKIYLHGVATLQGKVDSDRTAFCTFTAGLDVNGQVGYTKHKRPTVYNKHVDNGGTLERELYTDIQFGYIPDSSDVAEKNQYIAENSNPDYTKQVDPIEIFNGDVSDAKHISGITVPTQTGINKWDNALNTFGRSHVALNLAKAIMSQYDNINRRLEGTFRENTLDFDRVYTFGALPFSWFIVHRSELDLKMNMMRGVTFREIGLSVIQTGGSQGGNTIEAEFKETGRYRCVVDGAGVNTGNIEYEVRDENPNSDSYGDINWVDGGLNTGTCPIGQPPNFYYGTDDVSLDVNNLTNDLITFDGVEATAEFNNPGGEYIYFVHRNTLGLVDKVSTEYQDDVTEDFQYLADININGYTYKVLRQDYVTAEFNGLQITFRFV